MKTLMTKHSHRSLKAWAIALLGGTLAFQICHAQNYAIITGSGWSGGYFAPASTTRGDSFTVGSQSLTINALGVWGGYGFAGTHEVGLWTSTGTLLDSLSVSASTANIVTNGFYYIYIAPITLSANTTYVMGAYYGSGNTDDIYSDGVHPASDFYSQVTFGDEYNLSGSSLEFPTVNQGSSANYIGANAAYFGAVPEPSTLAVAGLGGLSLLLFRRRKS
ncbi:MAG: DUF4082 domain-containing protein [Limisphaerales bacterium]